MKSTALLIEDDPTAARLMELMLSSEGYQLVVAQNGLQGLKMARANPPDLILLDLMLPGQDGFEVLHQLRAEPRTADIPVIIVSAKAQTTDMQTATKIGADAYLTKPYKRAELVSLVGSLLSKRPEKTTARGTCVILVGPRGGGEASVAVYVGLALVGKGEKTTVVDFRPFSVEHSLLLGMTPSPAPISLFDLETKGQLAELTVQHTSGLCLLNNLEGREEAGQLAPEDTQVVLDVLSAQEGFVLAHLPLYPADALRKAVSRCDLALLVTQAAPALLAAARAALTVIERASADENRIGVVLTSLDPDEQLPELGRAVMGLIPSEAGPDDPAFDELADRLRDLT